MVLLIYLHITTLVAKVKEQKMANKRFWLGIPAMVVLLVFGMTFIGCDDGSTNGSSSGADSALNGTWVQINSLNQVISKSIYDNGMFETYASVYGSVELLGLAKGAYSTNNGKIIYQTTHIHGQYANLSNMSYLWIVAESGAKLFKFDNSKWYSFDEYKEAILSMSVTKEQFESNLGAFWKSGESQNYSVGGNTLTIINSEGITSYFTRE